MSYEFPKITRLDYGKQFIIIHEITPLFEIYGVKQFRIAYHITDYELKDLAGNPFKTPVAWVFITEPEIKPEERIGKTPEQIKKLWQDKFIENLRNELKKAIDVYRLNREVFRA
jgi:hypothetical protein